MGLQIWRVTTQVLVLWGCDLDPIIGHSGPGLMILQIREDTISGASHSQPDLSLETDDDWLESLLPKGGDHASRWSGLLE